MHFKVNKKARVENIQFRRIITLSTHRNTIVGRSRIILLMRWGKKERKKAEDKALLMAES